MTGTQPIDEPRATHASRRDARWAALVLTAAFLSLIFVPGFYHLAWGIRASDLSRWSAWFTQKPAREAIRDIETELDQTFVLAKVARTLMMGVPVQALRVQSPEARRGGQGYLFLGSDIQVTTSAGFLEPRLDRPMKALRVISDLSRQLREKDIHLLVVPLPAKASIYPDLLMPGYDRNAGPYLNLQHHEWIDRLRSEGVDVLDLTDLFWSERLRGAVVYHAADSHWSHHMMRLSAKQIADRIRPHLADAPRSAPFQTRRTSYEHEGDLVGMDGTFTTGDEPLVREEHVQLLNDGGLVIPGNAAPVLLIGDSFAEQFVKEGAGLSQQMMCELGIDVQCAAIRGASGNTMRLPLQSPAVLERKRVVVMAFTIRLLLGPEWTPDEIPH